MELLSGISILAEQVNRMAMLFGSLGILVLLFVSGAMLRRRVQKTGASESARDRIARIRSEVGGAEPPRLGTGDGSDAAGVRLATRLAAQLDGKAERLECLIEEAAQLVKRLEALTDRDESPALASAAAPPGDNADRSILAPEAPVGAAPVLPADPLFERIFALADQGQSVLDIARSVDEPAGKVELVLSLRAAARRDTMPRS